MNKKRLFAIVLFIVLGLFMFTFANPRNNKDNKKANGDILTPVEQTNEKEPDVTSNEEQEIITTPVVNDNQIIFNRQPVNTQNRETAVVPTVDLTKNKQAAIDELNNYKKDYEFTDDTDYKKIIDEYTDKINNSDSKDDINKNLEDGKDVIDKLIEDDLNQYKEKAKEEVHKYASDLDFVIDISSLITEIDTQIDNQTTKEAIDKVVEEAKDILDNLLKIAKEEAISQLKDYKKDYPFNEQNKETRRELVEEGINNINDATTVREVLDKLKEAIEKIDKLIDEDLNEYKEASKGKIDQHYKADDYSKENQGKIEEIIEKAKEEIDKKGINEDNTATIKDEIDKIVEDAIKAIDNVQMLKDTEYKVKFVDKNGNIISEQTVLYGNDATAPTNVADFEYKNVTYSFDKWIGDYTNVKEDLTIKAEYKITKIIAQVYLNNFEIPNPKTKTVSGKGAYSFFKNVELKVDNDLLNEKILADKYADVATNDDGFDIRSLLVNPDELPLVDGKYKTYEYYVIKFIAKNSQLGVHIDVKLHYDEAQELLDLLNAAKEEAINNISNHLTNVQVNQDKVDETVNKYVDKVKEAKTIEEVNEIEKEALAELDKIEIVDTKAPVIRLNGNRVVNVEVYDSYIELGATMTDDYDEGTDNLQPSGIHYYKFVNGEYKFAKKVNSVDTSELGMYKVSYSYTDKAGNKSVNALNKNSNHVVREVYVKDTTAPQVKLNGDRVVNVEINETYTELGATMTDNYDETINNLQPSGIHYYKFENGEYKFSKAVDSVDTSKEGMYKVSYSYTDLSGNKSVNALNNKSNHVVREVYVKDSSYELRKELRDLLNTDYSEYQDTKTSETYNNLINTVEENEKYRDSRNIEELKEAIADIKDAINGLVDIKLERIELSRKSRNYFVGDENDTDTITVKAFYNDSTRNRVLGEDEYDKNGTFDSSASGTKTITYSYEDKTADYTYTVKDIVLERIELSSYSKEYNIGDQMEQITVTAIYNDTRKNRTLGDNEYATSEDFDSSTAGAKTITYSYNDKKVDYKYTIVYTEQQLNEKCKSINVKLVDDSYSTGPWYDSTYIEDYKIIFTNVPNEVSVKSVIQITNNLFNHSKKTINLIPTDNPNVFNLSYDDYYDLRDNNTFFEGQHIVITYVAGNTTTELSYGEAWGKIK